LMRIRRRYMNGVLLGYIKKKGVGRLEDVEEHAWDISLKANHKKIEVQAGMLREEENNSEGGGRDDVG